MKITKKLQKEIIRKLDNEKLYNLPFEEICIYAVYRLEELIKQTFVVSLDEVKYRFCEAGHGNRRFDPLILDIVLNTKFFTEEICKHNIRYDDNFFFGWDDEASIEYVQIKKKLGNKIRKEMTCADFWKSFDKNVQDILKKYEVMSYN